MRYVVVVDYSAGAGGLETYGPYRSSEAAVRARDRAYRAHLLAFGGDEVAASDVAITIARLLPLTSLPKVGEFTR